MLVGLEYVQDDYSERAVAVSFSHESHRPVTHAGGGFGFGFRFKAVLQSVLSVSSSTVTVSTARNSQYHMPRLPYFGSFLLLSLR